MTDNFRMAVAPIRGVEFRDASANHDGSLTFSGYAAVFDQETTLYDSRGLVVKETMDPRSFDKVLRGAPTVHLNMNHNMDTAVASTLVPAGSIGSLTLRADDHGLYFMARADREDPDAQRMAIKMQRGVISQASFAFTIGDETVTQRDLGDGRVEESFRILEVKDLFDVAACQQGAYNQTTVGVRARSLAAEYGGIGQPVREAVIVSPVTGGEIDVIASAGVVGNRSASRRLQLLRLQAMELPTKKEI
jgi:HK97 family phage prohead protease